MRVLRRNRGWATLDVRNDFIALGEAVSGYGPSKVVMIMAGIILHGFYHPAAVQRMASALRLPGERGQGGMEWALAALGSYDEMLKVCRAYRGPQGFPYRWIKDGTEIAESVRPHLSDLYEACVSIVACRRPSMSVIDSMLPDVMGW